MRVCLCVAITYPSQCDWTALSDRETGKGKVYPTKDLQQTDVKCCMRALKFGIMGVWNLWRLLFQSVFDEYPLLHSRVQHQRTNNNKEWLNQIQSTHTQVLQMSCKQNPQSPHQIKPTANIPLCPPNWRDPATWCVEWQRRASASTRRATTKANSG